MNTIERLGRKRPFGFGKFRSHPLLAFVWLAVLASTTELAVAVEVVSDDFSLTGIFGVSSFDVYDFPVYQWACKSLLDLEAIGFLPRIKEKKRDQCLKRRAGGRGNLRKRDDDDDNEDDDELESSSDQGTGSGVPTIPENGNGTELMHAAPIGKKVSAYLSPSVSESCEEDEGEPESAPAILENGNGFESYEDGNDDVYELESPSGSASVPMILENGNATEIMHAVPIGSKKSAYFVSSKNASHTSPPASTEAVTKEGIEMALEMSNTDRSNGKEEEEEESERFLRVSVRGASPPRQPQENYTYTLFQENDGHESDPDGIPARYLEMQNYRREQAKVAMENTLKWRKENDIDTILARPHPKFDVSKRVFPHRFCGREDAGHVVFLQRPGLLNLELARENDLAGEELLFHYVYVMEYLWRILDPAPDALMTSIIDLTGIDLTILRRREKLKLAALFISTMDAHFPQRSHRTLVINAPRAVGTMYKLASPLLRESTRQRIQIYGKGDEQDEALRPLLSDCLIPKGSKTKHGNDEVVSPPGLMEEELRNFCLARLEDAGMEMQPVVSA